MPVPSYNTLLHYVSSILMPNQLNVMLIIFYSFLLKSMIYLNIMLSNEPNNQIYIIMNINSFNILYLNLLNSHTF